MTMRKYLTIMERAGMDYDFDPSDAYDAPDATDNPNYIEGTVEMEELVLDIDMFNIVNDLGDEDPTLSKLFDEADRLANKRIAKEDFEKLTPEVDSLYDTLEQLGTKKEIPLSKAAPALIKLYKVLDQHIADPEEFEWDEPEDPDPYRSRGLSRSDFM